MKLFNTNQNDKQMNTSFDDQNDQHESFLENPYENGSEFSNPLIDQEIYLTPDAIKHIHSFNSIDQLFTFALVDKANYQIVLEFIREQGIAYLLNLLNKKELFQQSGDKTVEVKFLHELAAAFANFNSEDAEVNILNEFCKAIKEKASEGDVDAIKLAFYLSDYDQSLDYENIINWKQSNGDSDHLINLSTDNDLDHAILKKATFLFNKDIFDISADEIQRAHALPILIINAMHLHCYNDDLMTNLCNANLSGAQFTSNQFINVNFTNATLENANLQKASLYHSKFINTNLAGADLSDASVSSAHFINTNLKETILKNVRFTSSYGRIEDTDLLKSHSLEGAHLADLNFSKCEINKNNLNLLKNTTLIRSIFTNLNLDDMNLSESDLSYSSFDKTSLKNANLQSANLSYADFSNANLEGADLSNAKFSDTNLTGANLRNIILSIDATDKDTFEEEADKILSECVCTKSQKVQLLFSLLAHSKLSLNDKHQIAIKKMRPLILDIRNLVDLSELFFICDDKNFLREKTGFFRASNYGPTTAWYEIMGSIKNRLELYKSQIGSTDFTQEQIDNLKTIAKCKITGNNFNFFPSITFPTLPTPTIRFNFSGCSDDR